MVKTEPGICGNSTRFLVPLVRILVKNKESKENFRPNKSSSWAVRWLCQVPANAMGHLALGCAEGRAPGLGALATGGLVCGEDCPGSSLGLSIFLWPSDSTFLLSNAVVGIGHTKPISSLILSFCFIPDIFTVMVASVLLANNNYKVYSVHFALPAINRTRQKNRVVVY